MNYKDLSTIEDVEVLNMTSEEYEKIQTILGRVPNKLELELFSILWSEHASYKNSRKWLEILPRKADHVLVEAGKESAGVVDIGDGQVAVFKLESHNHPCAVQPRLGASTGMRVVNRDIFSMGARPVALLNSLRFGNSDRDTARWLFDEVVNGIADFEKGFGIPVIGGEVFFCDAFNTSPIVNTMSIGVAQKDELVSAVAKGEGNLVAVIGVPTGKDGISGDAFVADMISDGETKSISFDQMRDIQSEKHLYKALSSLIRENLVIGVQTIGGQGIIGALIEMASRGNSGIDFSVEEVPLREKDMSLREILISETWGRMLICFRPGDKEKIKSVVEGNSLSMGVVGKVNNSGILRCQKDGDTEVEFPVKYLGLGELAPVYEREASTERKLPESIKVEDIQEPDHYPAVVDKMLKSLNVTSKKWLTRKFSKTLRREAASTKFPSDAGIVELGTNNKALLATVDSNPAYFSSDPYNGARISVAEAMRNIVCGGGTPLAITDCLNFGNPYDPAAYADFVDAVKGLADACKFFDMPVVSGNVSFYNQRSVDGHIIPVVPTPVIGVLGIIKDVEKHTTLSFKHKGDMIFLVGRSRNDINGSEYLRAVHGIEKSLPPYFNPEEEKKLFSVLGDMVDHRLARSVHDVSNGGLFFALLESAVPMEFGFDITTDAEVRRDAFLFGEAQGRVIVSVSPEKQDEFVDFMVDKGMPFSILGHVTKGEIRVDDESFGYVDELKAKFENRLKWWAEGKV
ncbi:phosphoribosylformylglycinamidine synthase subunit PurL [Anaerophaga thermohalophila]|uniref:phosphoribosylformylglycinamidine synthase subunit PurL n=1 Tax=Anaerophaga thermohalophila TaxID=177400 RepID=UPI0002F6ACFE|nr:phosphoribosylformylglycinamidine synthase subunit PurL [Anaerophaga thermohalophila]